MLPLREWEWRTKELSRRRGWGGELAVQANGGAADAKLRAIVEHGSADTLFAEEGAIGGVQIFEAEAGFADFEEAMLTRDFRVGEGKIGAFAADDGACASEREAVARLGPGDHREAGEDGCGQVWIIIDGRSLHARSGSVAAGEGGHRRNDHGFVGLVLDLDDGGLPTFGAPELNLGVLCQDGVVQEMLLPAMNAARLHKSKVPRTSG